MMMMMMAIPGEGAGSVQLQLQLQLLPGPSSGFLSWFRNGLLATGVGVISYVQSDVGREAAYGFFILGGICVSYGSLSYLSSLVLLRRTMMLSFSVALFNGATVTLVALFWLCAICLYIGRLEVEIIQDEDSNEYLEKEDDYGKTDK
ncbi:transmembrane protein 160 [Alligator sinensis]|uniref:Transmembrane protein 160 n=1 Tax=Alligator sinensis TaxID=38654 RepID=A0A3Q0HDP8_ALLSI|nr:transmembrane protein 160 [Alligator sinensis]